jgi:hypothetical protein
VFKSTKKIDAANLRKNIALMEVFDNLFRQQVGIE